MTQPKRLPFNWQQLLAAYADRELDADACAKVRSWLDTCSEGYSQLEVQRDLSPLNLPYWDSVRPAEPDTVTWARVWNRIESALEPARSKPRRPSRWWRRGLLAAVLALPCSAVAAAVIFAFLPNQAGGPAIVPINLDATAEVFQVASKTDVEIISIRDADVDQLVVGEPPFNEAMMLVAAGDVRLQELRPARDGMVPEANMGGSHAPMIYAPIPRTP